MNQPLIAKDGMDSFIFSDSYQNWTNYDNAQFYENIPLEILQGYAKEGGLDSGIDIEIIKSHIAYANSILEVGAGYGRAINHLFLQDFAGQITAIERCKNYINLLKKQFDNKIKLYHTDLNKFETPDKFDVILWLWAGICEFTPNEQARLIKKLILSLKDNGILILDSILPSIYPTNATHSQDQYHVIKGSSWIIHTYIPTANEIQKYSEKAKAKKIRSLIYQTTTSRKRVLYLIYK